MKHAWLAQFALVGLLGGVTSGCDPEPEVTMRGGEAVLAQEIHLERGMHCIDCHFLQDSHGDGNLYAKTVETQDCDACHSLTEPPPPPAAARNWDAIGIKCVDCHGTGLDHTWIDQVLLDQLLKP
jgi:hypothetical protein